jgi:hypothetical protein
MNEQRGGGYMGAGAFLVFCAVMWYVVIPFHSWLWADAHEIDISVYASVQAMDNATTHEYIVECLEDDIITWAEYAEIRRMVEKYPVIEQVTKERR